MNELNKDSKIGVIGSGTMGSGIAELAASNSHNVVLVDSAKSALEKAREQINKNLAKNVEKGKLNSDAAQQISARISYASLNELKPCALVIEAIVEDLQVKKQIFSEVERIVNADCILASNTSSLSIASIASACRDSSRIIGIHFFNPATLMPLVEIVPWLSTNHTVTSASQKIIESWGKCCVLCKDTPGFIVNRVARPYYGEALRIADEGIADYCSIDKAMRDLGFRMGPFELMDFIGNDINYKVTQSVFEAFYFDPRYKPSLTQKRLVEANFLGKKTQKGYYDYAPQAIKPEPSSDMQLLEYIQKRILYMLINEAADAAYLKVASLEAIDLAMTKGVNYPKGLLAWADEIGLEKIVSFLNELQTEYAEDRYRTSVLLKQKLRHGQKFY